jgi:hypothetical protein
LSSKLLDILSGKINFDYSAVSIGRGYHVFSKSSLVFLMGGSVLNLTNMIAQYFPLICRFQRGIASPTNSSINNKTSGWYSATLLILP